MRSRASVWHSVLFWCCNIHPNCRIQDNISTIKDVTSWGVAEPCQNVLWGCVSKSWYLWNHSGPMSSDGGISSFLPLFLGSFVLVYSQNLLHPLLWWVCWFLFFKLWLNSADDTRYTVICASVPVWNLIILLIIFIPWQFQIWHRATYVI